MRSLNNSSCTPLHVRSGGRPAVSWTRRRSCRSLTTRRLRWPCGGCEPHYSRSLRSRATRPSPVSLSETHLAASVFDPVVALSLPSELALMSASGDHPVVRGEAAMTTDAVCASAARAALQAAHDAYVEFHDTTTATKATSSSSSSASTTLPAATFQDFVAIFTDEAMRLLHDLWESCATTIAGSNSTEMGAAPVVTPIFVESTPVSRRVVLSFDCGACRGVDFLAAFADRGLKSALAKWPDAHGQWPDLDVTSSSWIYLRPSPSAKVSAASGRIYMRTKTQHFVVGSALLDVVIDRAAKGCRVTAAALCTLPHITHLVHIAHRETGERRLMTVRLLARMYYAWRLHPALNRCDQCPPTVILDRLHRFALLQSRRNDQLSAGGGPGVVSRLQQMVTEVLVAAWRAQEEWYGASYETLSQRQWNAIVDMHRTAADPGSGKSHNGSVDRWSQQAAVPAAASSPLVGLDRLSPSAVSSSNNTSTWKSRRGIITTACERGICLMRADLGVTRGRWYWEVRLPQTAAVVAVGMVTKPFRASEPVAGAPPFGTCAHSWCFDGSRLCRWHNGMRSDFSHRVKWKGRDVLGLLLDLEEGTFSCTHNGKPLAPPYENVGGTGGRLGLAARMQAATTTALTYFPCVSFNPVGCEINFGGAPFASALEMTPTLLPYDPTSHRLQHVTNPLTLSLSLVKFHEAYAAAIAHRPRCSNETVVNERRGGSRSLPPWVVHAYLEGARTPSSTGVPPADPLGRSASCGDELCIVDGKPRLDDDGTVVAGASMATLRFPATLTAGRWYCEVTLHGDGLVRLGWATAAFTADTSRGRGAGDDPHSWCLDGCRMVTRHHKQQHNLGRQPWRDGDVVGCWLDMTNGTAGFTLNGQAVRDVHDPTLISSLDLGPEIVPVLSRLPMEKGMFFVITLEPEGACTFAASRSDLTFLPPGGAFAALGTDDAVLAVIDAACHIAPGESMPASAFTPDDDNGGDDDPNATERNDRSANGAAGGALADTTTFFRKLQIVSNVATRASGASDDLSGGCCWTDIRRAFDAGELGSTMSRPSDVKGLFHVLVALSSLARRVYRFGGCCFLHPQTSRWAPTRLAPHGRGDDAFSTLIGGAMTQVRRFILPPFGGHDLARLFQLTSATEPPIKLTINRRRAATALGAATTAAASLSSEIVPPPPTPIDDTVFGQIFSLLRDRPPSLFKAARRLWSVSFIGEGADDVGGPYRESISTVCHELMSDAVPLFVPTSNQLGNVGERRHLFQCQRDWGRGGGGGWLLQEEPSGARTNSERETRGGTLSGRLRCEDPLRFVGRLMGGCFRTGEPFPIALPSSVWKQIVGEPLDFEEDVPEIDAMLCRSVEFLEPLIGVDDGATSSSPDEEASIDSVGVDSFTTLDATGAVYGLIPGCATLSRETKVTRANLASYLTLLRRFHLTDSGHARNVAALVSGFHDVVPSHALGMLHWRRLELAVCGQPDFSVATLQANARYEPPMTERDLVVVAFWQVLSEMSSSERSWFARFVSGRDRLSSSMRLKIMPANAPASGGQPAVDALLPRASTCFFWITLPAYSSKELLHRKLMFAIKHCVEIDADFRVRDSGGGGMMGTSAGGGGPGDDGSPPRISVARQPDDTAEFEDYSHLLL